MILMLSQWMTAARANRLVLTLHVALTTTVFAFLTMMVLSR